MNKVAWACMLVMFTTIVANLHAQTKAVSKPLFDDPKEHGAADPVVIYNKQQKMWWMFYTNRRAMLNDSTGVQWVHGTKIGISESKDGRVWKYRDTANINYRVNPGYTFWAPDIIENKGLYHMYLTYVPGIFTDWNHPREIVHLTSTDLFNWNFEAVLPLGTHHVIDASLVKVSDGLWRLWYNDEKKGKAIAYAESTDLYNWIDKGTAIPANGEGPKVFRWRNKYFMIVDVWKGMEIYSSDDLLTWTKQEDRILEKPGRGVDDQAIGGHCDVVVNNNRAYIFYFTHPGRTKDKPAIKGSFENKRSVIQLAELHYNNGVVSCNRDEPVGIHLVNK
jgi:sucrose-6-phosphate hydrolase SacC (GH32 family)